MELVCPAGSAEKLAYAYAYGADTAYIGLKKFSLRVKADNFHGDEWRRVAELKARFPGRRLYCALNVALRETDLGLLRESLGYFRLYPIDAFIVQDLGAVRLLRREFPEARLHLSTQASCLNSEAVKMYRDLGFSRVVMGREASLSEIRRIKDAVPEMEVEAFAHGAMCIAYSGRCLMSAYLTGRSAQAGFCSQPCRWSFDVTVAPEMARLGREGGRISAEAAREIAGSGALALEERQRRGEFFPVFEGEDFTAVLSSRDLRMIGHLREMRDAGIDAVKVEGRMKSVYYVAMVSRAYRKAIDALVGRISDAEAGPFVRSLDEVAHRECTTGFYFSRAEADRTTVGASDSPYLLAATVGPALSEDESAAVFAEGARLLREREDSLAALHPAAREAALRDEEAHPGRKIRPARPREGWRLHPICALNKIDAGTPLEFVSPDVASAQIPPERYEFVSPRTGLLLGWANADHECALHTDVALPPDALLRMKDAAFVEGAVRASPRS